MQELIERLEKLTGPDRGLGGDVLLACGWSLAEYGKGDVRHGLWTSPRGEEFIDGDQPDPTGSIDAAVAVVPAAANCHGYELQPGLVEAYVSRNNVKAGHWIALGEHPSSPAIALCIAALRARATLTAASAAPSHQPAEQP